MALIKCPECDGSVSDKALSCPHCGNPIEQKTINEENGENQSKWTVDWKDETDNSKKKSHSPLALIGAILCGIGIFVPMPFIFCILLLISSMVLAIIDLALPSERKHKIDDWAIIIVSVVYPIVYFMLISKGFV